MENSTDIVTKETPQKIIQARLISCAHCQGRGTCSSGKDGCSCELCVKKSRLFGINLFSKVRYGVVCSVCLGTGQIEPMTERLNKRIEPMLAISIVYAALFMVFWMALINNSHFNEILAFSSTLIGSITGYYFSGKRK